MAFNRPLRIRLVSDFAYIDRVAFIRFFYIAGMPRNCGGARQKITVESFLRDDVCGVEKRMAFVL